VCLAISAACTGPTAVDVAARGRPDSVASPPVEITVPEPSTGTSSAPVTTSTTSARATSTTAARQAPPTTQAVPKPPKQPATTTTTMAPTTCAAPSQFGPYVHSVATVDGRRGLVGGANSVRITDDAGATWTVACMPDGTGGWVRGITVRGRNAWAVAGTPAAPVMIRSTDAGQTWRAIPVPATGVALNDLTFLDENHGWIAGTRPAGDTGNPVLGAGGVVFRTTDGGTTWEIAHEFSPEELSRLVRVTFTDHRHGIAFGQNQAGQPALLATGDAGATWSSRIVPDGIGEVRDLVFVDQQHAWLLGIRYERLPDGTHPTVGIIMASSDGGITWTEQRRTTGMNVFDLDFTDPHHGHVIGDAKGASWLVSTTDGGATWKESEVPGRALTVVDFSDPDHGWVAGLQGACLRVTTDGGTTWNSARIDGPSTSCS
jgi:photosystem II stability/assembly factor-like uncharacterized protein